MLLFRPAPVAHKNLPRPFNTAGGTVTDRAEEYRQASLKSSQNSGPSSKLGGNQVMVQKQVEDNRRKPYNLDI